MYDSQEQVNNVFSRSQPQAQLLNAAIAQRDMQRSFSFHGREGATALPMANSTVWKAMLLLHCCSTCSSYTSQKKQLL